MAEHGAIWSGIRSVVNIAFLFLAAAFLVSAERRSLKHFEDSKQVIEKKDYFLNVVNFLWRSDQTGYQHVWPLEDCGWFDSWILWGSVWECRRSWWWWDFVPMLTLIIGFDPKSSTTISKCMIMGAAGSTVYYNLKLRHPTLELLIIDYNLALLFQPMLMLGISIGVAFNVVFADWMVTRFSSIILFRGTSTKAFFKGVETWKKETILKKEATKRLESNGNEEVEYKALPGGPSNGTHKETNTNGDQETTVKARRKAPRSAALVHADAEGGVSSQEDCAIKIQNLESKLDSIVCTTKDRKELEKHIPTPSEVAHSFLTTLQNDERANYQLDAKFRESYLKKVVSLLQCPVMRGSRLGKGVNHIEVENGIDQRDGVVDEIEEGEATATNNRYNQRISLVVSGGEHVDVVIGAAVAYGKVTPKVQSLIKILLKYQQMEDFRAIVFVESSSCSLGSSKKKARISCNAMLSFVLTLQRLSWSIYSPEPCKDAGSDYILMVESFEVNVGPRMPHYDGVEVEIRPACRIGR
ncbi:hypothetical protein IFM89_039821 [Coptis chinensis]|uniref:Uncharacterized protein n=1 Tax=Coptis chinensis TaxID=261450 RepID=A0A835GTE6_9MAGN|nr:hypothetical protein IFM89_039821 [Coptis chinensis]